MINQANQKGLKNKVKFKGNNFKIYTKNFIK